MSIQTALNPIVISIPCLAALELGEDFTLLPFEHLPEKLRTYEKIRETALGTGLQELPPLSRLMLQEVMKAVILALSDIHMNQDEGSAMVLLSGVHLAYPYIDPFEEDQSMEDCVSAICFFIDMTKTLDILHEEIQVGYCMDLQRYNLVYGLFVGNIDN